DQTGIAQLHVLRLERQIQEDTALEEPQTPRLPRPRPLVPRLFALRPSARGNPENAGKACDTCVADTSRVRFRACFQLDSLLHPLCSCTPCCQLVRKGSMPSHHNSKPGSLGPNNSSAADGPICTLKARRGLGDFSTVICWQKKLRMAFG